MIKPSIVPVLLITLVAGQVEAYMAYSAKRGVGWGDAAKVEALHVSWYYNWDIQTNAGIDPAIEYVPMRHNKWWRDLAELANVGNVDYLLAYNEPDHTAPNKPTVAEAVAQWPDLEAAAATYGLQIGSAACSGHDNWWQNDFMTNAAALGLQVDFMTFHRYPLPTSANSILTSAAWYYNTYTQDVWVTEFNAADWDGSNEYAHAQSYTFMAEVLYGLESTEYIKRYAVFPWDYTWGEAAKASHVFTTTNTPDLTPMGLLYANYRSSDIHGPYTETWYYVHNRGPDERLCRDGTTPTTTNVYTEGSSVEFRLADGGSGNYFIVNRGSGGRLGYNGSSLYWSAVDTNASVQWTLADANRGWRYIDNVGHGGRLQNNASGSVVLGSASGDSAQYKWAFVRANAAVTNSASHPAFANDPLSLGGAVAGVAYAGTLAGSASDADGNPLTYAKALLAGPSWLTVTPDGSLSGTPVTGDLGVNSWTILVEDGTGGTDAARLNITVSSMYPAGAVFSFK